MNRLVSDEVDDIAEITKPDGSLDSHKLGTAWGYVDWSRGSETVILDGEFTFAELRQIADHMEKFSTKEVT